MSETYSLFEFLRQLASDGPLRADYVADPRATLAEHGLAGLSPLDVRDALVLVEDVRTADYDPDHVPAPTPEVDGDTVGLLDAYVSAHDPGLGPDPDLDAAPDPDPGTAFAGGFADPDDLDPSGFGAGEAAPHDLPVFDVFTPDEPGIGTDFGTDLPYPDDLDLHHDPLDAVVDLPHPVEPPDPG